MSHRIHVVHISSTVGMGGLEKSVLSLITGLPEYKHTVVCVSPDRRREQEQLYRAAGADIVWCSWPGLAPWIPSYRVARRVKQVATWVHYWKLALLLRTLKPDMVHIQAGYYRPDLIIAAVRLAVRRCVWTVRGQPPSPKDRNANQWRRALRTALQTNTVVTAVSCAAARGLKDLEPSCFIRVVYNGVDLSRFRPATHAEAGVPNTRVRFGFCGRLSEWKGVGTIVKAASLMDTELADFLIAGDGPQRLELEEEVARLGLQDRFRVLGYIHPHEVPSFLQNLEVFVFPSRSEGLPNALLEALACGLPCISSNVGGIPDILGEDGGIMVPPDDPEALADAMLRMMDPEVRRHYSVRAPEIAKRFNIEECIRKYAEIYEELLERRGG
jgi:glycosyltransferase involved in cell wall biosynthesis